MSKYIINPSSKTCFYLTTVVSINRSKPIFVENRVAYINHSHVCLVISGKRLCNVTMVE